MNTAISSVLDVASRGRGIDPKGAPKAHDGGRFDQVMSQTVRLDEVGGAGGVEEVGAGLVKEMLAQLFPPETASPKTTRETTLSPVMPMPNRQSPANTDWELAQAPPDRAPRNPVQSILDTAVPDSPMRTPNAMAQQSPPFQVFLDKAVDFFLKVSDLERQSDFLMGEYVKGNVSLDELMVDKAKVGVAISFTLTLFNQVTQTIKEIQNLQI
ncbi:hypothetical protein EBZ35_00735 [bacterium]|nr:hypothetical protein [bacterium]